MKNSNPIEKNQIVKIHVAKTQLNLSDQNYREILSGFINEHGTPCSSCKELNSQQAEALLSIFTKIGWKQTQNGKTKKYEEFAGRSGKFASPAQMRKIEALWMKCSREKTSESLNHFIHRISGKDHITFIERSDVNKIIRGIELL